MQFPVATYSNYFDKAFCFQNHQTDRRIHPYEDKYGRKTSLSLSAGLELKIQTSLPSFIALQMDHYQLLQQRFSYLKAEDLVLLGSLFQLRTLEAGEFFIKAGKVNYAGALVIKGLLRNYHLLPNQVERTVLFTNEGKTVGSYSSIIANMPSVENVAALETTVIAWADTRELKRAIQSNNNLMRAYLETVEQMLLQAISRIDQFVLLSPEQRYTQFVNDNPTLEQRIPQKHLASYLGITPISLSRMRKRMVQRKLT